MKTLLLARLVAFTAVGGLSGLTSQAQSFGEAGGYGLKPSTSSGMETNTNFATGRIAPSLPLITLPGVAGAVTVGLQYQAGAGVKANELGSEIGLGWALSGGGSITRDVKGFPDDSQYGWFIDVGGNGYRYQYWPSGAGPNLHYMSLRSAGDVVKYFKSRTGNADNTPAGPNHYGATSSKDSNLQTWLYPASQASNYGQYTPYTNYTPNSPNNAQRSNEACWIGAFAPDNGPDV